MNREIETQDMSDEDDESTDNMPSLFSIVSLVAACFCPMLLPAAAVVIGLDVQKRTMMSETRKLAKKLPDTDLDLFSLTENLRPDVEGASITHTFDLENNATIRRYTKGVVTSRINFKTGLIEKNISVD